MCCLFGMIDCDGHFSGRQRSRMLAILAEECEARGKDAAGIAFNSRGTLKINKHPGPAHTLKMRLPDDANIIMGHTRMTTQGSERKNYNNHPFLGQAGDAMFALAHNGVLHNDHELRQEYGLPETKVETDSYVAVQLIEYKNALNFDSLAFMAEQVLGSFTFTVLDHENNLYIVKGDNPFCLYYFPEMKLYLYASTEEILKKALWKMKRFTRNQPQKIQLQCGDILCVDQHGNRTKGAFEDTGFCQLPFTNCYPYELPGQVSLDQTYEDDLLTVAAMMGYSPDSIRHALNRGIPAYEIEELLYCGGW